MDIYKKSSSQNLTSWFIKPFNTGHKFYNFCVNFNKFLIESFLRGLDTIVKKQSPTTTPPSIPLIRWHLIQGDGKFPHWTVTIPGSESDKRCPIHTQFPFNTISLVYKNFKKAVVLLHNILEPPPSKQNSTKFNDLNPIITQNKTQSSKATISFISQVSYGV